MKPTSEMTFEEKISICLKGLPSFSLFCKEIHDASGCDLEACIVKCFCDELFSFTKGKKTSHVEETFLLDICKKWRIPFDEMFTAVRYKKFCLDYFKKSQTEKFNKARTINRFIILSLWFQVNYCQKVHVTIVNSLQILKITFY